MGLILAALLVGVSLTVEGIDARLARVEQQLECQPSGPARTQGHLSWSRKTI